MERVTFIVEATGQRLACLLNPATLELTRRAGIRARAGAGGAIASRGLSDDPLILVGGGVTELKLDLLFDMSVAGSNVRSDDVRDLTRPLWELAEAHAPLEGGRPPVTQFFWGKREGFRGAVLAVAERLEHFTSQGVPRRSWLRMRLRRVAEPSGQEERTELDPVDGMRVGADGTREVVSGNWADGAAGLAAASEARLSGVGRLDSVAATYLGDASLWRRLAALNDVDDPARMAPGTRLRLATPGAGRQALDGESSL